MDWYGKVLVDNLLYHARRNLWKENYRRITVASIAQGNPWACFWENPPD